MDQHARVGLQCVGVNDGPLVCIPRQFGDLEFLQTVVRGFVGVEDSQRKGVFAVARRWPRAPDACLASELALRSRAIMPPIETRGNPGNRAAKALGAPRGALKRLAAHAG